MTALRDVLGACSATAGIGLLAGLLTATGAAAGADGRLTLELTKGAARPQLTVMATAGRPDAVRESTIAGGFKLSARPAEGSNGYKILDAELLLKGEGNSSKPVALLKERAPRDDLTLDDTYSFEIDPRGPTAQNAVALCSNATGGEGVRSLSIPIVWRVKSGRFDYRWMQAGAGSPEDMLSNPDYYSSQETESVEAALDIDVTCEATGKAVAAKGTPAKSADAPPPEKKSESGQGPKTDKVEVSNLVEPVAPKSTEGSKPVVSPARDGNPSKQVSATKAEAETFTCEGGMVRQMGPGSAQYVCLCPGNTQRESKGANAFSCERRAGRRS